MLADVTRNANIALSDSCTINLGNYTLTLQKDASTPRTLTTTAGKTITLSGTGTLAAKVTNKGTLNVSGGTVSGAVTNSGTLNVSGGTVSGDVTNSSTLNVSGGTVSGDVTNSKGTLTVSDSANVTGAVTNSGALHQTGGTISGTVTNNAAFTQTDGTATVTNNDGGVFTQDGGISTITNNEGGTLVLNNGTVTSANNSSLTSWVKSNVDYAIDNNDNNKIYVGNSIPDGATKVTPKVTPVTGSDTAVAQIGETKYKTLRDAIIAATDNATIKLLDGITNATQSETILVDKNVTLDLDGKTLTTTAANGIFVNDGATLTLTDTGTSEKGKIVSTWEPGDFTGKNDYEVFTAYDGARQKAAIKLGNSMDNNENGTGLVINNGVTIKANSSAISAGNHSSITLSDGTIESDYSCGIYYGNVVGAEELDSSFTMTGGTIKAGGNSNNAAIQVSGTVTGNKTTLDISGGTIEFTNNNPVKYPVDYGGDEATDAQKALRGKIAGNPIAVYASGLVDLKISDDAKITSTVTGVEIRAGELTVTGGTIESTAESYGTKEGQKAGASTFGAGIAVAQHTTDKNINVNISGEKTNVVGNVALALENPLGKTEVATAPKITITGGTFESKSDESPIAARVADSRPTINIRNATFVGNLENAVADAGSTSAFKITGTVTIATRDKTTNQLVPVAEYNADTATLTYKVDDKSYTVQEGWWKLANQWLYLVADSDNALQANAVATLQPATDENGEVSTTTLELTTGTADSVLPLDMTTDMFKDVEFTILDASKVKADQKFKLEITGNGYTKTIIGGEGNDTLSAVSTDGVFLDGGIGDDLLIGGDGKDTYAFSSGSDSIIGYTYGTDAVSLATGFTAPTNFDEVSYDGSNLAFKFNDNNNLTFKIALNVSVASGNDTYSYKGYSNGGMEYIALNSESGNGISLGAQHSTVFSGTVEANANYTTIDAANVDKVVRIIGNDKGNYIVSGKQGGTISGGEGTDTITAAGVSASLTLNGGAGDDLLIGGNLYNRFEYSEGKDSIRGYKDDTDVINVTNRTLSFMDATVEATGTEETKNDLLIKFDNANQLSIEGGANFNNAISVTSGSRLYKFTKNYVAHNNSITLTSGYDVKTDDVVTFDGTNEPYETINAAAVTAENGISIVGNANANYIFGPTAVNASIYGGANNDKINVSDRGTNAKYLFEYTEGKDEIIGFDATKDTVSIAVANITAAKASNSKLALTVDKNKKVLTLRGEDEIEKVSLAGDSADYLTKDGYVKGQGFSLFGSARGSIDLKDALYTGSNISLVAADSVKSQSVTLTGGEKGGTFIYAENNKRRDGFVYGGGAVSISGYEAGRDRIDLNAASLTSFEVTKEGDTLKDVVLRLNSDGTNQAISISGAAGEEVLLHDATRGRAFKKMVFAKTGVIENKQKNPTMVTVSGAAENYSAGTSIKKIYVTGIGREGFSVQAGDRNNTQIDASAAGVGISLSGGAKNDKLIGSSANDLFVYSAGKDVLQGYGEDDSISISSDLASSLGSAKITAGSKSIKFQFTNKNTLTIKSNSGETLSNTLTINDTTQTYAKNAIESGGQVTLTSAYSGTFNTASTKGIDGAVSTVDGSAVSKNLTYKGSTAAESLTGGTKKTTFKGAGGADTLVGGSGKDIFFYAKNDAGTTTIADFEFGANKDKLKIASGTISEISSVTADSKTAIRFAMNSGKNTANVGWFQVTSGYDSSTKQTTKIDASKVAIKANNTFYWFNQDSTAQDSDGNAVGLGQLITSDTRVSASDVSSYSVIDLNYSTNLAKAGVAVKVTGAKPK